MSAPEQGAAVACTASLTGTAAALLGVEDKDELRGLTDRLEALTRALPAPARLGIRAGGTGLDALSVLLTGRRLEALEPAGREAVLAVVAARPAGARLVELLKMPVLMAAGSGAPGRNGSESAEGPNLGGRVAGGDSGVRPDPWLDCVPSDDWPSRATADAVIVGSGAGGAMAARTLARAGMSVIVVEEGRRFTAADFRGRAPLERFVELYRGGGTTFALGRPPLLLPEGRGVGGTTLVNSGTCFRTPDRVLRGWADAGVDPGRFAELLDEVERTIEVAPQPVDVLGRNGLLALRGARVLGWRAAPLRRNAPGCAGSGECAAGCPRNAKNGVHLNALPQACRAGARIVTHAWTERVLVERSPRGGDRAAGIRARRPDGSALEILAPVVIVAAGAIQTPLLLRRSGLGRHPALGRGLAVHPATNLAGRFDEPVRSWDGVMQSVGIEELHGNGILLEATAAPPGISSFVPPGIGRALRAELAGADRLAIIGAMIADSPSGRVHGRRRAVVRYSLAQRDAGRIRRAIVAMGQVLFAAGAHTVLTGLPRDPVARTVEELTGIALSAPLSDLHLAGFHPTGTARLGIDRERTPVDPEGRLRGVGGVFVADASVLPSCPEVNPQLSVMAMALRVAGFAAEGHAARSDADSPSKASTFTL